MVFTQTAGTASSGYTAMSEDVGMLQFAYTVHGDVFVSRVSNQNGVSLLYIVLEIHLSGQEPSVCLFVFLFFCFVLFFF